MKTDDMIRIKCAGLIVLRIKDGRYALLINRGQLTKHDQRVLTPIGGSIVTTHKGITYLHSMGATQFERSNDLRFMLPKNRLPELGKWFTMRIDRELTPEREMYEELIDETKVLSAADLWVKTVNFVGYGYKETYSTRHRKPKLTVRLAEIFTVTLLPTTLDKLVGASQHDGSMIHFATSEEIVAGITVKGVEIGSNSKFLLSPSPSLPI